MGLSTKQVSIDAQEWAEQSLLHATPVNQHREPPLKCPRCESMNTKFCYYNNYNRSQPRYYCKACKRHWTNGGNLRNVPVGGARRNKRLKTAKRPEEEQTELPFCVPNFPFTTPENSGGFQASDDVYCMGLAENIEDPCNSGSTFVAISSSSVTAPLSSSTSMIDSLSDWSWDEFNALNSAGMRQAWEEFEIAEQVNSVLT